MFRLEAAVTVRSLQKRLQLRKIIQVAVERTSEDPLRSVCLLILLILYYLFIDIIGKQMLYLNIEIQLKTKKYAIIAN